MSLDIQFLVQSIISMVVIASPMDPTKVLVFNQAIANPPRTRTLAAAKVAVYVALVLGGAAVVGREVLDLVGIDLNAFSVVGGLIIMLMGFEMLYGGGTSKVQGDDKRSSGQEEGDALFMPLTLPLIAGPGAITTTITIASSRPSYEGVIAALIGAGVVSLIALVAYAWMSAAFTKVRPATMALIARLGGLVLATIGVQMLLGGLDRFFA